MSNASLDELIAEAELGEEAKNFIQGDLGRFLLGCANQEIEAAHEALEDVKPSEKEKIRELQNAVWRARSFTKWLVELVSRGENAIQSYKQQKQEG